MSGDSISQTRLLAAPRARQSDRVIGVGSPHGDDQVGWRVIDRLRDANFPTDALCAISDPVDMLEHLEGVSRLIVVDGCQSGSIPGKVRRLEWEDGRICTHHGASTHRISLIHTLQLARALGRLPRQVTLFTVEIESCRPQRDLSPAVWAALPELTRLIGTELAFNPRPGESGRNMNEEELQAALRESGFLTDASEEHLSSLASIAKPVSFAKDTVIFREGDVATEVYIILSGNVSLEICAPGIGCRRIMTLDGGDLLGWSPVLEQMRLTATARAVTPIAAIALNGRQLLTQCEHDTSLGYDFMRRAALAMGKRLTATRMQLLDVFGHQMPEADKSKHP